MANVETLAADTRYFAEASAPSTPSSGQAVLYVKTDGQLYLKNDAGREYRVTGGSEIDYVEKTSDTSITATSEATANTIVTGNAVTYDGSTAIVIEFQAPGYQAPSVSAASMSFWLYDGSSSIGFIGACNNPGTISATVAGMRTTGVMKVRITPSAAAHTYSIRASVTSGTGTVKGGAGGSGVVYPAFIRITKA